MTIFLPAFGSAHLFGLHHFCRFWTIFRDIPGHKCALNHPKRIGNGQNDDDLFSIFQRATFWSASFLPILDLF
jgi:hypothetical protein